MSTRSDRSSRTFAKNPSQSVPCRPCHRTRFRTCSAESQSNRFVQGHSARPGTPAITAGNVSCTMDALQCANANRKMACRLPSALRALQDDVTDKQERLSAPRSTEEHQMRRRPARMLCAACCFGVSVNVTVSRPVAQLAQRWPRHPAGQFSPLELRNVVLDDIHEAGKRGFRAILLCDLIEPPIQPVSVPVDETSDGLSGGLGRPIRRSSDGRPYSLRQDFAGCLYLPTRHPKRKARAKRAKAVQESDGKPLLRNDSYIPHSAMAVNAYSIARTQYCRDILTTSSGTFRHLTGTFALLAGTLPGTFAEMPGHLPGQRRIR